ncbi:MAG TPA: AAA family ATPase, partial [Candidatus Limnocylindrales bacterium]
AVMAVWGAPVAREDDAERAVRAALELVDAVTPLGVTARAGVLTGEAAVNVGAVGEGMVVGDIVNTAARLQSVAAPGTVLVGESTYRAASRAIAFEPAGEHALKGKATPVAAWKALRVIAERGDKGGTDLPEAPFVGRDEELRLLKDLLAAVGRDRKARLVSVTGPGGIGKSRLASELEKYVVGLVEPVFWLSGRSPAYGEGITFWALGEMIRRLAGLAETDDEPTTRARITAMVADHVLDQDERSWIERALLTLLGIDAGVVGSDQLFAAWRTFFERLAAKGVVVMAFEDLHWADPGLLDFIDQLLGWSRSLPIYVLTLARPELLERRPNWAAGKRSFTSLFLDPLSVDAMHELLTGLAPGIPESALVAIVARADGIPLYAVETVRMLLGKGQLSLIDGVYGPAGDFTSFAVPESLTALIGARLDGLDPTDRALLQDAAVLGQSFTPAGLAAVSGIDVPSLEPRLQSLTRRELLTLQTDPRSPERGQYAFVQALIREVAYNTLAKRDRKARHLAAARFFESLSTDEIAGGLAGHYLAALRNAPEGAEADAVAAQARIALRAAAERATALGSHDQAVGFFNQALEVTTEPPETAELLERAGESASAAGRHEAAEAYLRRAIDAQRD